MLQQRGSTLYDKYGEIHWLLDCSAFGVCRYHWCISLDIQLYGRSRFTILGNSR